MSISFRKWNRTSLRRWALCRRIYSWVGGPFVTTGTVDAASISARGGGFEYTNSAASRIKYRSSLYDSRFFSLLAISHQDFLMEAQPILHKQAGQHEIYLLYVLPMRTLEACRTIMEQFFTLRTVG